MVKKKLPFVCKQLCLILLCVCLLCGLCLQTATTTVSYVTSLSATCVNTFSGEIVDEPAEPVTRPEQVQGESDIPPTGSRYAAIGASVLFVGLAGATLLWSLKAKRREESRTNIHEEGD